VKNLVLIVHESIRESVTDQLRALEVTGFTVSQVEGHGPHTAEDEFLSARDRVVGFVPRVRVDIVLPCEQLPTVLDALRAPDSGFAERGTYWVSSVEGFGRL